MCTPSRYTDPIYQIGSCTRTDITVTEILWLSEKRLQDCGDNKKEKIYGIGKVPGNTYIKLDKYLEDEKDCVEFCFDCLSYLYTDCKEGTNAGRCNDVVVDLVKG
jgi:hypothetical protein